MWTQATMGLAQTEVSGSFPAKQNNVSEIYFFHKNDGFFEDQSISNKCNELEMTGLLSTHYTSFSSRVQNKEGKVVTNEIISMKRLAQCLAYSRRSINAHCYYNVLFYYLSNP